MNDDDSEAEIAGDAGAESDASAETDASADVDAGADADAGAESDLQSDSAAAAVALQSFDRAAQLRQEFDAAFALPPSPPASDLESFLAIRVAGQPFSLRVRQLRRLEAAGKIVTLPGAAAALIGLTGVQGRLTPVYALAAILGVGSTPGNGSSPASSSSANAARWIAVCGQTDLLGLCFDGYEGFVQVRTAELLWDATSPVSALTAGAIRAGEALRPIIDLERVQADIRKRVQFPSS